jgi:hypothetical protein
LPFDGRCFPCLLWDSGDARTIEERHRLVSGLLEQGCRYFVCGGSNPSAWEDAADEAHVAMTLDASHSERNARLVMTTAHRGESEDDVAFFFVLNTSFDHPRFSDFLVLVIGTDNVAAERLAEGVRRHARGQAVG